MGTTCMGRMNLLLLRVSRSVPGMQCSARQGPLAIPRGAHYGDDGMDEVDDVDDVLACVSTVSSSSLYRKVGLRAARVRPQNLLGDRPLLTAVKRHPRWSEHCAHSAIVQAYLIKMETNFFRERDCAFFFACHILCSKKLRQ